MRKVNNCQMLQYVARIVTIGHVGRAGNKDADREVHRSFGVGPAPVATVSRALGAKPHSDHDVRAVSACGGEGRPLIRPRQSVPGTRQCVTRTTRSVRASSMSSGLYGPSMGMT